MRSSDAMQPLVFAILRGLTPPAIETVLYDERLEQIPLDADADLVAITVETYTAQRAYQIADAFRQRNIPVVMGGYHPSFLPEEALLHADAVVIGDAENVWTQLLNDLGSTGLKSIYRQETQPSLDGVVFDRSIFDGKRYTPLTPVQFGRGCKFACDFCSINAFYGRRQRHRPVNEVIDEIRALGKRHIFLVDDNLFNDLDAARSLFKAMIPLKISWSCQVSIDISDHPDIIALMKKSGCLTALIGFESLNGNNLAQMKKKWNLKYGGYTKAINRFYEAGIMLYGTFIFGYDHDTAASFGETLEFALKNHFFLGNFNPLTPTPGAQLYDRLAKEDRLLRQKWWLDPTYRYGEAIYQPKNMTAQQLTEGCFAVRKAFNAYHNILRRALGRRQNWHNPYHMFLYLGANVISRREILSKQGRLLGSGAI